MTLEQLLHDVIVVAVIVGVVVVAVVVVIGVVVVEVLVVVGRVVVAFGS